MPPQHCPELEASLAEIARRSLLVSTTTPYQLSKWIDNMGKALGIPAISALVFAQNDPVRQRWLGNPHAR